MFVRACVCACVVCVFVRVRVCEVLNEGGRINLRHSQRLDKS